MAKPAWPLYDDKLLPPWTWNRVGYFHQAVRLWGFWSAVCEEIFLWAYLAGMIMLVLVLTGFIALDGH